MAIFVMKKNSLLNIFISFASSLLPSEVCSDESFLFGKTIKFYEKFVDCYIDPNSVQRFHPWYYIRAKMFVGQTGKVYLFYDNSDNSGISTVLNGGKSESFTINTISSLINGRRIFKEQKIPVEVIASSHGPELEFSYSWNYHNVYPSGTPVTDTKYVMIRLNVTADNKCSIIESRLKQRIVYYDNVLQDNYSCGPAIVDTMCEVSGEHP